LLIFCWFPLFIYLFLLPILSTISSSQVDTQNQSALDSEKVIKGFLSDANKSLTDGNMTKTLSDLLMVQRLLGQIDDNSSSIEHSKLLIRDTMQAIINGNSNLASTNLGLITQQLVSQTQYNQISNASNIPPENAIPSVQSPLPDNKTFQTVDDAGGSNFLVYDNPVYGVKMLYPKSWSERNFGYHETTNNTIVGFFSPSKTGLHLENISGVIGQFVPYLDIFVFDAKNMSLAKIVGDRLDRIRNYDYFVIDESKELVLKGGALAHILVYSTTIGGHELFKKLQVYTVLNNKVYLITFTSQEDLFTNYLPIVQKMIDSFELRVND
jgi:hypothetical protein